MRESLRIIADVLQTIGDILYIIMHPSIIWNWLVTVSYWIVSIGCVVCMIYYAITKSKRWLKYIGSAIVTYTLVKGVGKW